MRSRDIKTNFASGVLAPSALARTDIGEYNNGLQDGNNIVIEAIGGMKRRAGTLFIQDYGVQEYMRILPFMFNREEKYLIVFTIGLIDIYRDNVLVSSVTSPYTTAEQLRQLDFAQSADVMVLTQSDVPVQLLRRLGDDSTWDIVPATFVEPPQIPTEADPSILEDVWTTLYGYPKRCTFHQGRLWFANNNKRPQSVWASVSQDFFNFALGTQEAGDSIQETLDTDFINPIANIYSAGKLQVYTIGAEFVNLAQVLTPVTSAWSRQTDYGSSEYVPPVAIDGATVYLDSTGRTIRNFVFSEDTSSYSATSISLLAENLIKDPVRLGTMRGTPLEASNYIYVVNIDGTIAVCNIAKAQQMIAWTSWNTQGDYKDIINLDDELYVLVERFVSPTGEFVTYEGVTVTHNGEAVYYGENPDELSSHWFLERVNQISLTDCGAIQQSVTEGEAKHYRKDNNNFFGVYQTPEGSGKVVIVENGIVMYKTEFLKANPLDKYVNGQDEAYKPFRIFSNNDDVRERYFDLERGYQWFMYSYSRSQRVNNAQSYIDGLTHLLGLNVTCNLDGNVFPNEEVVAGDSVVTVKRSYPEGTDWLFNQGIGGETFIIRTQTPEGINVVAFYNGVFYDNLQDSEYGYLIAGIIGEPDSEYLQLGNVEKTVEGGSLIITANSSHTAGVDFPANTPITCCIVGGGGSGSALTVDGDETNSAGGGHAGNPATADVSVPINTVVVSTIGVGGTAVVHGGYGTNGNQGGTTSFGTVMSAIGGAGGNWKGCGSGGNGSYAGNGAIQETCLGTANDGARILASGGTCGKNGAGGQSSGASNGGRGSLYNSDNQEAGSGGVGSGGGGACWTSSHLSGAGGRGEIRLDWNDTIQYYHSTRKMKLIETTVADGIVNFSDTPFRVGEAGLAFQVFARTMLIAPNAGAGSVVNEPKRIVSITARFKDTQGVNVQGFDIPERDFGEEVLDEAVPLLTGITKLRILGYSRETYVTITQIDPMPFNLLGLDIEINY